MTNPSASDVPNANSRSSFYGWKIAWALLVILSFSSGLSFYNHPIILNALAMQPQFSVQSASFAITIFFIVGGFAGLFVAKLVERFDVRICITLGAVLSCLALSLLRYVSEVWQLYIVYAIFGAGFSGSALLPATTIITRWFQQKRSVALSVASTGLSLGGVVLTPICAALVETISLKNAAPIMGLMYLLGIVPILWLVVRASPEAIGLQAYGNYQPIAKTDHASVEINGVPWSTAKKGLPFWGVSLGYVFLMMAQVGGIAHQYGLAKETLSDTQTAVAVAIIPVASIVGRLLGGWILQSFSVRIYAVVIMLLQTTSLLLLGGGFNSVTLCMGLAVFGATVGNLLMLQPLVIAEFFGVKEYAKIFSVSNLLASWGTACGPALLGYIYALNNNQYQWAYVAASAAGLLGLLLFVLGSFPGKIN